MADIKGTPQGHTRHVADFPEVSDKLVAGIEVSSEFEHFGITINFADKTTLTLTVEPCVAVFPVLAAWENGEEKTIRKYKPVRSKIQRT